MVSQLMMQTSHNVNSSSRTGAAGSSSSAPRRSGRATQRRDGSDILAAAKEEQRRHIEERAEKIANKLLAAFRPQDHAPANNAPVGLKRAREEIDFEQRPSDNQSEAPPSDVWVQKATHVSREFTATVQHMFEGAVKADSEELAASCRNTLIDLFRHDAHCELCGYGATIAQFIDNLLLYFRGYHIRLQMKECHFFPLMHPPSDPLLFDFGIQITGLMTSVSASDSPVVPFQMDVHLVYEEGISKFLIVKYVLNHE